MNTDDERIINSLELAKKENMKIQFLPTNLGNYHPNTVRAEMVNKNGDTCNLIASSIGGGEIQIISVNGFPANISGIYDALIIRHMDKVGMISKIAALFEKNKLNIVSLYNNRESKGKIAITIIEIDGDVPEYLADLVSKIDGILSISVVNKI